MEQENRIREILEICSDDSRLLVSEAYSSGGIDPLSRRLERAALNQATGGPPMDSRYAIWANTVRDNIRAAIDSIETGEKHEALRHLRRAANSLSAFSEIQALFDPMGMGHQSLFSEASKPEQPRTSS